jgi:hypothetical protein
MRPERWRVEERFLLYECATNRPRIKRLVFFHGYFDESGTNNQRPVMAMAGWVLRPTRLAKFNRDWRQVLRKYRVQEHKAARLAAALEGNEKKPTDFTGWDQRKAYEYRSELNQVIDKHMGFGVFGAVVKDDYARVMGPYADKTNPLADPYRWLIHNTLECIFYDPDTSQPIRRGLGALDHVKVIFDQGYAKPGVTQQYFTTITTDPTYEIAQRGQIVGGYNAVDSVAYPAIQAADHLVWGANRGMEEVIRGLGVPGKVRGAGLFGLKRVKIVCGYWNEQNLLIQRKKQIGV